MIITAIEKAKGSRYTVYVDGEYWYILDKSIIMQFDLHIGLECKAYFLEEVRYAASVRKAEKRALYLLEYRDHSKKELTDKLCRSVPFEIAQEIANEMEERGYINDRIYGEKLAHQFINIKKQGYRKALYSMLQKGIEKELAEDILDAFEIDTIDQIQQLVEKKYSRYLVDEKGFKKVRDALARLGHSYEDIRTVLDTYND